MFIINTEVNPPYNLIEDHQYKEIRYAFSTETRNYHYTNITSWVKCRDFLNDAFFIQQLSEKNKTPIDFEVYGFKYRSNLEITLNRISIISENSVDLFNIHSGIYTIINLLETSVYPTHKKTTVFNDINDLTGLPVLTINISPIWLTNTYTLSLFTLLLRLFTYTKQNINVWQSILTYSETTGDTNLVWTLKLKKLIVNQLLLNLTDKEMPGPFDSWSVEEIQDNRFHIHEQLGILSGVYDTRFCYYIKNKSKVITCPQDVKDVILF